MSDTEKMALDLMKAKYFEVAKTEKYPHTPKETEELDKLEKMIREMQAK